MSESESHKCAKCGDYYQITLNRKWIFRDHNSFLQYICDKYLFEFMNSLEITFIRLKNDKKKNDKKILKQYLECIESRYNKLKNVEINKNEWM